MIIPRKKASFAERVTGRTISMYDHALAVRDHMRACCTLGTFYSDAVARVKSTACSELVAFSSCTYAFEYTRGRPRASHCDSLRGPLLQVFDKK